MHVVYYALLTDESGKASEEDGPKKDGEEKPHDEL